MLGFDKHGAEYYQVSLGGSGHEDASLAQILGPSFARADVPDVISNIIDTYKAHREAGERFIDTYRRVGIQTFKEAVYKK